MQRLQAGGNRDGGLVGDWRGNGGRRWRGGGEGGARRRGGSSGCGGGEEDRRRRRRGPGGRRPTFPARRGASVLAAAQARFGRVDILIKQCRGDAQLPLQSVATDDLRRMVDLNVMGLVYASQAVLPLMKEQGERAHRQHFLGRGAPLEPRLGGLRGDQGGGQTPFRSPCARRSSATTSGSP